MKALMQSFGGMKKGESIEHKMLTNSIERAQRRVEGRILIFGKNTRI